MNIKKTLIILILIIPIILILALNTASVVIAVRTPDNPTEIEVRSRFNKIIRDNEVIEVSIDDENNFLIINIFPEITREKGLIVETIASSKVGEILIEKIENTENRYSLIPKKVGYVQVVISSKANINIKRQLNFEIISKRITSINVLDAKRNNLSLGSFESTKLYGGTKLLNEIYPIIAFEKDTLEWGTSPIGVVDIDDNGQLTVLERELVEISVGAYGKDGRYCQSRALLDFRDAIVKRDIAYTSSEINENWVRENLVFEDIKDVVSIEKNEDRYVVRHGEKSIEVKVLSVDENEIGFLDGLSRVYTNNGMYRIILGELEPFKKIDDNKDIKFQTSDFRVLEINEKTGHLYPKKAGEVTVSATYKNKTISKKITVRELRNNFEMSLGFIDQYRGIRQDRVWAKNFYLGGERYENGIEVEMESRLSNVEKIDTMDIGIIDDDSSFDIIWTLSKEGVIEIEKDDEVEVINAQKIKFLDSGCGDNVTLTAYMAVDGYPLNTMKRSYTFKVFDDVEAINVYNLAHLKKAFSDKVKNVVFQSDIEVELKKISSDEMTSLKVYSNFWGNGFSLSGETGTEKLFAYPMIELSSEYGRGILDDGSVDKTDQIIFDDIVIETTKQYRTEGDLFNMCVGINSYDMKIDQVFRYVQIKNCTFGMEIRRPGNIFLEGSIVGDNLYTGVFIRNLAGAHLEDNSFVVKNCVFKNSLAPSIAIGFDGVDNLAQAVGKNSLQHVYFEGDNRFYNWQDKDSLEGVVHSVFKMVLGTSDPRQSSAIEGLMKFVAPFWRAILDAPEWRQLFKRYGKKEYASMALFVLGGVSENDYSNLHLNDEFLSQDLPFDVEGADKTTLALIKLGLGVIGGTNVEKLPNNRMVGYNFNKESPDIGPFEPVPESEELYASLIGEKIASYDYVKSLD